MTSVWKKAASKVRAKGEQSVTDVVQSVSGAVRRREKLTPEQRRYRAQEAAACAKAKAKPIPYKLDGYKILDKVNLSHLKRVFQRIRLVEADFRMFYKVISIEVAVVSDNRTCNMWRELNVPSRKYSRLSFEWPRIIVFLRIELKCMSCCQAFKGMDTDHSNTVSIAEFFARFICLDFITGDSIFIIIVYLQSDSNPITLFWISQANILNLYQWSNHSFFFYLTNS